MAIKLYVRRARRIRNMGATAERSTSARPLRLRPAIVLALLQLALWLVLPLVLPGGAIYGLLGAVLCGALIMIWWLFFSRAPWLERLGAIALMVWGVLLLKPIADPSIAGAGQGRLLYFLPMPVLAFALVVAAYVSRNSSAMARRAAIAMAVVIGCATFLLIRTDGVRGGGFFDFHWRWTPSAEDRLLAETKVEPVAPAPVQATPAQTSVIEPAVAATRPAMSEPASTATRPAMSEPEITRVEWPGFRGPARDDVVAGERIETDWSKNPPVALWRQPIGPGWSSFAIQGNLIYTQEQRGDQELISAYDRTTGRVVWRHREPVRFYESNAGAGPRGTPTLDGGRVYAIGATGIVNALDARTGAVIWAKDASAEASATVPTWGFSSSPLVVGDIVIVAAAGRLVGFDRTSGARQWMGPAHGGSYSSPHLAQIGGTAQVLLLSTFGVTSVKPADGTVLWEHEWNGGAIVQPAMTSDGDVLINSIGMTGGAGIRRLAISHASGAWKAEERWTSTGLKPYFNDFVVHKGHAYGFDGNILSCIELAGGARVWKGGRYGAGQLILLPNQDVLLVLSEEGELALVSATPDKFTEIARAPAIDGKTWNHPVLVGNTLFVRNGEQMAAFRLALQAR